MFIQFFPKYCMIRLTWQHSDSLVYKKMRRHGLLSICNWNKYTVCIVNVVAESDDVDILMLLAVHHYNQIIIVNMYISFRVESLEKLIDDMVGHI